MNMGKYWIALVFTVYLLTCVCQADEQQAQVEQRRQERRNRQRDRQASSKKNVNMVARVSSLEEKLSQSMTEISELHGQLKEMNAKLAAISDQNSPAYQNPPEGSRLRHLQRCPLPGLNDFYYVAQFRNCYHLAPRDTLVNWTDAVALCKQMSPKAHLVSIESAPEQEFLQKSWQIERGIASLSRFWTSGRLENEKWTWQANNRPVSYEYWIPTTEHNDDRFACLAVLSSEAYNWGDVACWAEHMVTCEINL